MQRVQLALAVFFLCHSSIANADEQTVAEVPPSRLDTYWIAEKSPGPAYSRLAMMTQLEGCFVAAYGIDETGNVHDARIVYQKASISKANRQAMNGNEKKAVFESQANAILEALNAVKYQPAPANAARVAVLTRTPPIIVSMLSLERPDNEAAVARARAAHASRREVLYETCAAAQKDAFPASP